jgi:hypothetical protein
MHGLSGVQDNFSRYGSLLEKRLSLCGFRERQPKPHTGIDSTLSQEIDEHSRHLLTLVAVMVVCVNVEAAQRQTFGR